MCVTATKPARSVLYLTATLNAMELNMWSAIRMSQTRSFQTSTIVQATSNAFTEIFTILLAQTVSPDVLGLLIYIQLYILYNVRGVVESIYLKKGPNPKTIPTKGFSNSPKRFCEIYVIKTTSLNNLFLL